MSDTEFPAKMPIATTEESKAKRKRAMSEQSRRILAQALQLPPLERAELVEQILASFGFADRRRIDEQWSEEIEDRIRAYEQGQLESRSAAEIFDQIERDAR